MAEEKRDRWTPHNPLGVIALFVFLIETIATISLHSVAATPYAVILVWFIVLYPTAIAASFFILLWAKREALFGPMDYADQGEFSRLLLQKVERIEIKQDAAGMVDQNTAIDDVLKTVERLLELDDPWSAINVGRAFLKRGEHEKSQKVFEHIKAKIKTANEAYYKLLANLAYSQIGLGRYGDAIVNLLEVKKIKRGQRFGPWHSFALAYAHHKNNNPTEANRWIEHVRMHDEVEELDLDFFASLYPELADQIKSLGP